MPCMGSKSPFHTWLLGSFSSKLRMLFAYDPFCSQRPLRWGGIHGTFTEFIQSFSLMAPGPPEYTPQCSVWHFCLRNVVYISLYFSPNLMVSQTHPCGTSTLCYANNVVVFTNRKGQIHKAIAWLLQQKLKMGPKIVSKAVRNPTWVLVPVPKKSTPSVHSDNRPIVCTSSCDEGAGEVGAWATDETLCANATGAPQGTVLLPVHLAHQWLP